MKQTTSRTQRTRRKTTPPVAEAMHEPTPELVPYDDTLLECARTQWQFGDWESLVGMTPETLQHHPQRAKLALLAAAGHFQLGREQEAHQFIRLAEDWGCNRRLITQMLVSGVHHTLGCATGLLNQPERALEHFRNAVRLGGVSGDPKLLTEARAREFTE